MRALSLVEPQRAGERFKHGVGGAACVTPLQPGVVVDADPGQQRDFLAAQSRDAPVAAIGGQASLLRE